MPTSGSTAVTLEFTDIAEEAWERAGREMRTGYDLRTARRSMNLMTIEWQEPTPHHGFTRPLAIEESGATERFDEANGLHLRALCCDGRALGSATGGEQHERDHGENDEKTTHGRIVRSSGCFGKHQVRRGPVLPCIHHFIVIE